jgi:hypothetical protein
MLLILQTFECLVSFSIFDETVQFFTCNFLISLNHLTRHPSVYF